MLEGVNERLVQPATSIATLFEVGNTNIASALVKSHYLCR